MSVQCYRPSCGCYGRETPTRTRAGEEEISEEVEAALDEILRQPLGSGLEEEEGRCFLIKNPSQLADPVSVACRDCANS